MTIRVEGTDSPDLAIRKDLKSSKHYWSDGMVVDSSVTGEKRKLDEAEGDQIIHRSNPPQPGQHLVQAGELASRGLTRTLMETYGWSIKFFSCLEELVAVMRDAIEGEC